MDDPTAGAVLGRALARSSEKFLVNDAAAGHGAEGDDTERVHESRVALRRMRSNLRTFRLLVDPAWGTTLRAELAWYADRLGETRDLHVLRDRLSEAGTNVLDDVQLQPILRVIDRSIESAGAGVHDVRTGERHARLTKEILRACEDPPFTAKADEPADEVLGPLLKRTWHDVRGAGRLARKKPTDEHLHKLRIRLKGLRYGAETVVMVDGSRDVAEPAGRPPRRQRVAGLAGHPGRRAARAGRVGRSAGHLRGSGGRRHPQGLAQGAQRGRAPLAALAGLRGD